MESLDIHDHADIDVRLANSKPRCCSPLRIGIVVLLVLIAAAAVIIPILLTRNSSSSSNNNNNNGESVLLNTTQSSSSGSAISQSSGSSSDSVASSSGPSSGGVSSSSSSSSSSTGASSSSAMPSSSSSSSSSASASSSSARSSSSSSSSTSVSSSGTKSSSSSGSSSSTGAPSSSSSSSAAASSSSSSSSSTGSSSSGRMSISGKNILDEHLQPFVMRGFNQGHGELTLPSDPSEDVSLGANTVRIIWRKWGSYNSPTIDGQIGGAGQPGDLAPSYLTGIITRVKQAKAVGLKVILAGDSNCGQNGKQGYPLDNTTWTYCAIDGIEGQNFWTPKGQAQFSLFQQTWTTMAKRLLGFVDFYEVLVEPSAVEGNMTSTQVIQDTLRSLIMGIDKDALFIMGAWPGYAVNNIQKAYQSKWKSDNNTILTSDLLDNAVTDPTPGKFASKVTLYTDARESLNVPVVCQQLGSTTGNDPKGDYILAAGVALRDAVGGSIGWTFWEKVSMGANAYGPYYNNGTQLGRNVKQTELDQLASMFVDTKIPASP